MNKKQISEYMRALGSRTSAAKRKSSARNLAIARRAKKEKAEK